MLALVVPVDSGAGAGDRMPTGRPGQGLSSAMGAWVQGVGQLSAQRGLGGVGISRLVIHRSAHFP